MKPERISELNTLDINIFNSVIDSLKTKFGEITYNAWLKFIKFESYDNGELLLSVPTRFIKDWINSNYLEHIFNNWKSEDSSLHTINLFVNSNAEQKVKPEIAQTKEVKPVNIFEATNKKESIEKLSSPLDPRFTFENFVVGKPNELAHAAALSVAEAKQIMPGSNPLFLYGGVGLGKTHLMHAIAWHIKKNNPNRNVIYLSAEKFMYQFIRALREKDIMSFKEQFRSVDVLMIDDVQFISGKDSTQEEFFHTFNALIDQHKQLVISADRSPSDLEGIEDRIKSRLGWGLVADVHATTYELRLGILQSKLEQLQVNVPKNVMEFLAHKITSNVRELEGALNKVVAHSKLFGREINIENTQEILSDLLRANSHVITVEDIKNTVSERFNIKVADMNSSRRSRAIARPRQVAMYLSKKLTTMSLPEIGRKFGGKDHTTVIHAIKKVEELMAASPEFADDVNLITKLLNK